MSLCITATTTAAAVRTMPSPLPVDARLFRTADINIHTDIDDQVVDDIYLSFHFVCRIIAYYAFSDAN
ncbi:hypothetical protein [Parasitella parasitica]|uniref:Uncharacterized protein n=1 Tax=Parasitella parasitica TaxID=35722 RepID=A0A0B7NLH0_9FUNG|nr:hypothetical protein [Parasitella parasitica]